ncbi:MAG: hypothetical protein ACTSUK_03925 [Promethearchaeota archaeon]
MIKELVNYVSDVALMFVRADSAIKSGFKEKDIKDGLIEIIFRMTQVIQDILASSYSMKELNEMMKEETEFRKKMLEWVTKTVQTGVTDPSPVLDYFS